MQNETIKEKMNAQQQGLVEKLTRVSAALMPSLPYHNFNHVVDVYSIATLYAIEERVAPEEMFMLQSAAMLHDIILVPMHPENEQRSAQFARTYLPQLGYTPAQTETVSRLILATKLPTNPQDLLERIICDADIDNLGRPDFFQKAESVRVENGVPEGLQWYKGLLGFLDGMRFYTEAAKGNRTAGKQVNRQKLLGIIKSYENGSGVSPKNKIYRVTGNEALQSA